MAQLPPKIPNMTPNWPNFTHQRIPSMSSLMPTTTTTTQHQPQPSQQPSWVDEFLDFSSVKRGAHRRSASDSIAFLEAPLVVEECRSSSSATLRPTNNEFDRLDDEQLMSMFSDDISANVPPTVSSSNPSTPSDHNSINDDKHTPSDQHLKNDSAEVQSSCKPDPPPPPPPPPTSANGDPIVDPKRVKRILANRQSAQRSRVRKLQYISELERSVTSLQTEVSALSPRVAFLDHQRLVLNVDNSALKQRIAALAQDKIFKDAHQEALKKEIERLRHVYHQQNLKKMSNNTPTTTTTTTNTTAPPSDTHGGHVDKGRQLIN
ncbi:basic leucine zipper 61-like [Telopea speciosissima]|uniref:basic leucine zipper 61-like n=1 Tax=Telopea speciosissima TaxID=54955 RepID=UPI001CC3824E|nr:basic leucine zipper 61-like [Telopea speciosissima]